MRNLVVDHEVSIREIVGWLELDTHVMTQAEVSRLALKIFVWIKGDQNEQRISTMGQ